MKNLSFQITSPKFLDESFTTQMDLLTGKVFYHSQLGEYLNMLPETISEAIKKAIWKYVFSRKVLAIPHDIHIDYCDNHTMKQDAQLYINSNTNYYKKWLGRAGTAGSRDDLEQRLAMAKSIKPSDITDIQSEPPREIYGRIQMCVNIREHMTKNTNFPELGEDFVERKMICGGFNKNGCMCGIEDIYGRKIPNRLKSKYEPLQDKVGFYFSDFGWGGGELRLRLCNKHRTQIFQNGDIEKNLDDYLEQHNYYYRNGYWVRGNPRDGYSWDTTRKHRKPVPHELVSVRIPKRDEYVLREGGDGVCLSRDVAMGKRQLKYFRSEVVKVYLPKFSKRLENQRGTCY